MFCSSSESLFFSSGVGIIALVVLQLFLQRLVQLGLRDSVRLPISEHSQNLCAAHPHEKRCSSLGSRNRKRFRCRERLSGKRAVNCPYGKSGHCTGGEVRNP